MSSVLAGMLLSTCLFEASVANNVSPNILLSMIIVEGGRPGVVSKNENGSVDLGVMQINDRSWLEFISKKIFFGDNERAFNKLRDDPCFNISVGAWILSSSIKKENGDVWLGVGRYHSNTPELKKKYIKRVKDKHKKLFKSY